MKRPVAFDLDDVVVDTSHRIVEVIEARHGLQFSPDRYYCDDPLQWCDVSREDVARCVGDFLQSDEHLETPPNDGVVEALNELGRARPLLAITGRPFFVADHTNAWLDRHLPGVFDQVVHTSHFLEDSPRRLTKLAVCRLAGAISLTDDLPEHLEPLIGTEVTPIHLDTHSWHGQPELPISVMRVTALADVVRYHNGLN